jgi:hypothetical protein
VGAVPLDGVVTVEDGADVDETTALEDTPVVGGESEVDTEVVGTLVEGAALVVVAGSLIPQTASTLKDGMGMFQALQLPVWRWMEAEILSALP